MDIAHSMSATLTMTIIRADGTIEEHEADTEVDETAMRQLIGNQDG